MRKSSQCEQRSASENRRRCPFVTAYPLPGVTEKRSSLSALYICERATEESPIKSTMELYIIIW